MRIIMKTLHKLTGFAAILLLLTGCGIPSVHPLYEPDDLIIKEELTGKWKNKSGKTVYQVLSLQDLKNNQPIRDSLDIGDDEGFVKEFVEMGLHNIYLIFDNDVLVTDKGDKNTEAYLAGLLKLGDTFYLDLYKYPNFQDNFSYPVHIFVKVEIKENSITIHEFREQWIKDLIKNRQIRIKHEVSFDNFLLTAPSQELKNFVRKYGNDPEAFRNDPETFIKITDDETNQ